MTFKDLNSALAERVESLCERLLPNGRRHGNLWHVGGTTGEPGNSLRVQLTGAKRGRWRDFASDEGGDLISLIEVTQGLSPKQAADYARDFLGLAPWAPDANVPPPFDPLRFGFKRKEETEWRYGSAAWCYRDAAGVPQAWVVRFDRADGGKDVMPIRMVEGKPKWKGYTGTEKRPLYNLDKLTARPDAPVLVVEGEKTADAAAKLFPAHVVVTWMGGTSNVQKADWTPLLARKAPVVLWADADAPGRKAMAYVAQLIPGSKRVNTSELPDKWDLADPIPEGLSVEALVDRCLITDPEAEAKAKVAAEKEAKEGEERYHLPPGCRLSEVESDLLKYGVFEHAGQVWTTYDGRGQRGKWATDISNCTVNIHRHIKTKDGAIALVSIRTLDDEATKTFDVEFDVFRTELSFTGWLGDNAAQWWGTDSSFKAYKRLLMDRMRKCELITELGTHPRGFFVFNNAMVNGSITPIDPEGCFQHNGQWYYVPSGNSIYANDPGEYAIQKLIHLSSNPVDFEQWATLMVRVHGKHAYTAIAYVLMTAFSGFIYKIVKGIPIMFYYGEGGGGKDALIASAQAVFGEPQPAIILTGPNSEKGMIKMMAESTDIIQNWSEYRKGYKGKDCDENLKQTWGRIGYRIAAVRGKKTETIPVNCTVMVSGNDKPTDNALLRRLILEVVEKRQHSAEDSAAFNQLKELEAAGVSGIFPQFYRYADEFKAQWYTDYFKTSRTIIQEAMGSTPVDSSIVQNMQVLVGTMRFFHDMERLRFPFTPEDLVAHMASSMHAQLEMRSEGSEVANFWTCFVWAVKRGQLVEGRDFKIRGTTILFHWGDVYAAYASAHLSVMGEKGERPGDMRAKLMRHPCCIGSRDSVRLSPGRNTSAIECDMEKSGTNLRALLVNNTEKFGEDADLLKALAATAAEPQGGMF